MIRALLYVSFAGATALQPVFDPQLFFGMRKQQQCTPTGAQLTAIQRFPPPRKKGCRSWDGSPLVLQLLTGGRRDASRQTKEN